jgi:hypothetical protein
MYGNDGGRELSTEEREIFEIGTSLSLQLNSVTLQNRTMRVKANFWPGSYP